MSLPKYLVSRYKAAVAGDSDIMLFWGAHFAHTPRVTRRLLDALGAAHELKQYDDAIKFGLKQFYGYMICEKQTRLSDFSAYMLEMVDTTRFVALWKDKDGSVKWEGIPTKVQRRYKHRYESKRFDRIEFEAQLVRKRDELLTCQEVVYASRFFPPKIREIIFERDDYTCQKCLRTRDQLKPLGYHLEVDHIVAWIDGGKTTYRNGQTLCSECNKGKHHAKSYLSAAALLQER